MASSGKKSDLDTPFSTGVGLYSGWVKPGQPNLKHTKHKEKNITTQRNSEMHTFAYYTETLQMI